MQATALEMIHDIREAFNELLEENDWMDMETRSVAEDKANGMTERIGYPEYITNDTRLEEEYRDVLKTDHDDFFAWPACISSSNSNSFTANCSSSNLS